MTSLVGQSNIPAAAAGFAVVDIETTGLYPTKDRIVEIAIVQMDANAAVTDKFCTLVDPKRDIGPTRIHGLTATSVLGAPSFPTVAPTVWQWLSGRVFVAHNVRFDMTFIEAELERCGIRLPPPPAMCTMILASSYLNGLPGRSLTACCEAAGIKLANHHSAIEDAMAAAELLACYRSSHSLLPESWEEELREASTAIWPPVSPNLDFHPMTREERVLRSSSEQPPLAGLVHTLPRGVGGDTEHYLALLDRVLEDRLVTSDELDELTHVAEAFGVTEPAAERAHREYLEHLAAVAQEDGIITDAERADFMEVAKLLAVPNEEAVGILYASRDSSGPLRGDGMLKDGDKVVFTGDMAHNREELEQIARASGLRVMSSVSSKTALVVVADPHSQSHKAIVGRERGVRIVTEQVFLYLVEHASP
jgi:DNA polymerase III subunit epsilon